MSRKQKVGKAESSQLVGQLDVPAVLSYKRTNNFCFLDKCILYFCQQLEGWSASYLTILFCKRNVKILTTTKKVTTTGKSMHFCSMSQYPCIDPVLQLIILMEATVHFPVCVISGCVSAARCPNQDTVYSWGWVSYRVFFSLVPPL